MLKAKAQPLKLSPAWLLVYSLRISFFSFANPPQKNIWAELDYNYGFSPPGWTYVDVGLRGKLACPNTVSVQQIILNKKN